MRRLYSAVCAWLEADAESRSAPDEHHPQGDNFTTTELDGRDEPEELHQQNRPPADHRMGFTSQHGAKRRTQQGR